MPPKCDKTEYVYGPIELTVLRRTDEKHSDDDWQVVLFGDEHVSDRKCPADSKCGVPVHQFLYKLFQNYRGPEFLDFFLEIDFNFDTRGLETPHAKQWALDRAKLLNETDPQTNYLRTLRHLFNACFQKDKRTCAFYGRPIRFHYADVRNGVLHSGTDKKTSFVIEKMRHLDAIRDDKDVKRRHVRVLWFFLKKAVELDIDFFFRISKIDKQLKKLNSYTRSRLRKYFLDYLVDPERKRELTLLSNVLNAMATQIQHKVPVHVERFPFHYTKVIVMGHLMAPLFDVYVLSRILRHNMRRVIVYAGAFHTRSIEAFLQNELGYEPVLHRESKQKQKDFQCLSLKGVPQTLFV